MKELNPELGAPEQAFQHPEDCFEAYKKKKKESDPPSVHSLSQAVHLNPSELLKYREAEPHHCGAEFLICSKA